VLGIPIYIRYHITMRRRRRRRRRGRGDGIRKRR